MTASTDIKAFSTAAAGSGGNRLTPAAYAALTTLLTNGFQAGTALSVEVNTVLAQTSFMAAGLANWMVAQGVSVPDDGNLSNLVSEISSAMAAYTAGTFLAKASNLSDLASLSTAITNLGFAQTASAAGYVKLPGGIIVQWDSQTISSATSATFSFPLAFPAACFQIVATDVAASTTPIGISAVSATQYTAYLAPSGTKNFHMIAIGH